ncbi:MAG: NlpC/P60 family protein [Nitrospirae bacterium YQR-1]
MDNGHSNGIYRFFITATVFFVLALSAGCSQKAIRQPEPATEKEKTPYDILEKNVYGTSRLYIGKQYKTGANPDISSYSDCSNLICAVTRNSLTGSGFEFRPYYVSSDRIYDLSYEIKKAEIKAGDLMFFVDGKNKQNHVGVITRTSGAVVYFVQASSQAGVVERSTKSEAWEFYWKKHFDSFRRWKEIVFMETQPKY